MNNNQMSLSGYVVGFVESAINNTNVVPPQPNTYDTLPQNMASLIQTNIEQTITVELEDRIERNVDIIVGGEF